MELDCASQSHEESRSIDVVVDDLLSSVSFRDDVMDCTRCFSSERARHARSVNADSYPRQTLVRTRVIWTCPGV